ncbi:MAG TPA: hypothetical protein VK531_06560 [Gemmatimonadales bacterium]|nr:hypothetical protein [Gemmatimonadales bacterium]
MGVVVRALLAWTLCGALVAGLARAGTAQERTTLGGYGEVHYTNPTGPESPAVVNLARFVVYLAHSFDDRLALRSELEVEDAKVEGGAAGGEVSLEQAYLDYRLTDWLTLRTGLVLAPVGIVNETHEPPTFNGVDRPGFDHDVIPTTWREIGVGAVGTVPGGSGLAYRVYVVNGLRAAGFSGARGIRDGRQEGRQASFANPSLTGRLEWARPGWKVGGSFWYGGTADTNQAVGSGAFAAPVALVSADARFETGPFALRAVVATLSVGDARAINLAYGQSVGSRIAGGYLEGAYNLLSLLAPPSSHKLNAFVRHERYDTQADVPSGVARDRSLARRVTTLGITYKPTWNTAFKGDYQLVRNAAGAGEHDVLSLGVGYQF